MNTMRRNSDRRWQLRDATAHSHAALDAAVGAFDDSAGYARYLAAIHAFRAPLNSDITPLVALDMADLGIPAPAPAPAPTLRGSALLGQLYVLEGAALGGQILRKRAARLGYDETFGARHLAVTPQGWLAFLARLDAAPDYDAQEAARAANATFALALNAFTKADE
ncbi:biliverdin-producing heme oxygenase [Cereibacter sp. SYSU M97828]|nr:biliverdin-producing heme oxygenase [Cereibacter flavus]